MQLAKKTEIIQLETQQVEQLGERMSESLSQAFLQNELFCHFMPENTARRSNTFHWFCQTMLRYAEPYGQIYAAIDRTTSTLDHGENNSGNNGGNDGKNCDGIDRVKGVAIWIPPTAKADNLWRWLRVGMYALPMQIGWQKWLPFLSVFLNVDVLPKADLSEPYWYLMMLGVAPEFQGQGVGSQLMQPILQTADRQGIPCYLETSTWDAVRLYQRHGFTVVRSGEVPDTGLKFWTMKRMPSGGSHHVA